MDRLFSLRSRTNFELPILPTAILGTIITAIFYCVLHFGPVSIPFLNRYCLGHPAAVATIWLFYIALIGLVSKFQTAIGQLRITDYVGSMLSQFVEECEVPGGSQRTRWFEAHWSSSADEYQASWLGSRIAELISRSQDTGQTSNMDSEARYLADSDKRSQKDGHSVFNIILLLIMMLGSMGAITGISTAMGSTSTPTDGSNSVAGNWITAMDTMGTSMTLSTVILVLQFAVRRLERHLLTEMDDVIRVNLQPFFKAEIGLAETDHMLPVRQMAGDIVGGVHQLVEQQVALWGRSMVESQKQWAGWTAASGEQLRAALCESLEKSLSNHAGQIEKIQQEAARQVDSRWQQWQITLSDQARVMHAQQKELVRQTEAIDRLVKSTCDLRKVEDAVRDSFGSFEMIEQLRQATIGISESVAVLASSLERAGLIRGMPIKPRSTRKFEPDPAVVSGDMKASDSRKAA